MERIIFFETLDLLKSYVFVVGSSFLCDVVLGLLCSGCWRNLQKQQQKPQGSESNSMEVLAFQDGSFSESKNFSE